MDISLIKTLYFNFYYLRFKDAFKFPFRVYKGVKIGCMGSRDCITILDKNLHIHLGSGQSFGLGNSTTFWRVSNNAHIVIGGGVIIGKGSQVVVDGELVIGRNFYCNANCIINSGKSIRIGDDALLGWDVTLIDGDGHRMIKQTSEREDIFAPIEIGNHVWIAAKSSILKGSYIDDDSVIAYGGLVSKKFNEKNILIGGNNQVLKKGIEWTK